MVIAEHVSTLDFMGAPISDSQCQWWHQRSSSEAQCCFCAGHMAVHAKSP